MYGRRYFEHVAQAARAFLGAAVERVLFVPYAVRNHEQYAASVRARFGDFGLAVDSVHDAPHGQARAVADAQALFVGGGNTFRLIDALWRKALIEPIRERVRGGLPYIGSSAGSNVACPTIKTTNDMPIVQPLTFEALSLTSFQINPHYIDPQPGSTHMGETREQRIAEFHEENATPVVGLREGAWLLVEDSHVTLHGENGARLFRRDQPPVEYAAGSRLELAG